MKPRIFLTEFGDVAQYIPDITDMLPNGAFILTDYGSPSAYWIGPNKDKLLERLSKESGIPIGEPPSVITEDPDLILEAQEMFTRCFSKNRINKADRELSVRLQTLRDNID